MDYKDILMGSAINTVIQIAQAGDGKSKWRKALMKVFREIARNVATEQEIRNLLLPPEDRR